MLHKSINIIENKGWNVTDLLECCCTMPEGKEHYEISKYSPAGEDFSFSVEFDGTEEGLIQEIQDYANGFDVDEHVEMWIGARKSVSGVPQSIRSLLEDAEEIKNMLKELSEALELI